MRVRAYPYPHRSRCYGCSMRSLAGVLVRRAILSTQRIIMCESRRAISDTYTGGRTLAFAPTGTGIIRRCANKVPRPPAMREVAALACGFAEGWALTRVPPIVRWATLMYGYYVVAVASSSWRSAGGLRRLASAHWESNLPRSTAPTGAPFCAPIGDVFVPRSGHLFMTPGHVFVPRLGHF